MLTLKRLYAS
jgi:hypothetical protein